jgi:hypothetical protein
LNLGKPNPDLKHRFIAVSKSQHLCWRDWLGSSFNHRKVSLSFGSETIMSCLKMNFFFCSYLALFCSSILFQSHRHAPPTCRNVPSCSVVGFNLNLNARMISIYTTFALFTQLQSACIAANKSKLRTSGRVMPDTAPTNAPMKKRKCAETLLANYGVSTHPNAQRYRRRKFW